MCRMPEPRNTATRSQPRVDDAEVRIRKHEWEEAVSTHFVELFGKSSNDMLLRSDHQSLPREPFSINWVEGVIIVGAGPAGLATAACLSKQGVPSLILEREDCIGSLWRYRTYDRLRLHIAKNFCELPFKPFPASFPTFPTRAQFLEYLDEYAREFDIRPQFNECVKEATYCPGTGLWRVESRGPLGSRTFIGRWLVVATGENAEPSWPDVPGMETFNGSLLHSCDYKSGAEFAGKRVLVVGGGNSGLEVSLDLANHQAAVFLSVRGEVHVLPKEMLGFSTFSIAMTLLKYLSLQWTDRVLLLLSRIILGETSQLGFRRPNLGPMEMKSKEGKTPCLDAGTLSKIREGCIEVVSEVESFDSTGCYYMDGTPRMEFDAVILATGFKSNVPKWLKEGDLFSSEGFPKPGAPCNWKGRNGLYSAGFARKGLLGVSMDALNIAKDIASLYIRQNTML